MISISKPNPDSATGAGRLKGERSVDPRHFPLQPAVNSFENRKEFLKVYIREILSEVVKG
jgi:hypothetical protein